MKRLSVAVVVALIAVVVTSCVRVKRTAPQAIGAARGASLWQQPAAIKSSDLFYGPWGSRHAPQPEATYTFVEWKHAGVNPGMSVRDPEGREWSVKQAPPGGLDHEGRVEVAVSRL